MPQRFFLLKKRSFFAVSSATIIGYLKVKVNIFLKIVFKKYFSDFGQHKTVLFVSLFSLFYRSAFYKAKKQLIEKMDRLFYDFYKWRKRINNALIPPAVCFKLNHKPFLSSKLFSGRVFSKRYMPS